MSDKSSENKDAETASIPMSCSAASVPEGAERKHCRSCGVQLTYKSGETSMFYCKPCHNEIMKLHRREK
jgi:predicted RNA-binding Zn-ribbon protein involved in translation (DUF1610 family)